MSPEDEHREIQSLLGAYALGAVDVDDQRRVESHLPECLPCRDEVANHLEVAGMLSLLFDERQTGSSHSPVTSLDDRRERRRNDWWYAAAAVAAIVVLAVGFVTQTVRLQGVERQLASATLDDVAAAAAGSDTADTLVLANGEGAAVAEVVLLPDGTGFLTIEGLPEVEDGRTYQLWGVMDDEVVSVGLAGGGPGTTTFTADTLRLDALVITEEEAGGVPVSEADAVAIWAAEG